MKIREVNENKKHFIALSLLADEQENMIDRYLEKGTMYVLEDKDVKAEEVYKRQGQILGGVHADGLVGAYDGVDLVAVLNKAHHIVLFGFFQDGFGGGV